ncbi:MAG: MerR family transcriptional regulator [Nodosilinea sp.]
MSTKTINEMAQELGLSRTAVKNWTTIAGLDPATTVYTEEDQAKLYEIKRLRESGKTLEEIKAQFNVVTTTTTVDPLTQTILDYGIKPAIRAMIPQIPQAVAEVIAENLPQLQEAFVNYRHYQTIELLDDQVEEVAPKQLLGENQDGK